MSVTATPTGPGPAPITSVDQIALSDFDFWTRPQAERDQAFALLRRDSPLPFYPEPLTPIDLLDPGPGYYAVTRYADVEAASRAPQIFSSARGATAIVDLPAEFLDFFGSMINLDDPRHVRLRRIVSRAFSPRIVQRTVDDIAVLARTIVDDLIETGPCDFVERVAARLPLEVICRMMGIPQERYADVFRLSNVILGSADPEYVPEGTDVVSAVLNAGAELAALIEELTAQRRINPTDDLSTALAVAEVEGERLTTQEIASFFVLLCVAGNETTRNAISHTLVALTDNPEQREIWLSDVDGVTGTAVDEIVRWATPVAWMRRTTTQDTELSGIAIPKDSKMLLFYCSANRDENVFDQPYRFDVRRNPNPHLGFGGPGPHFCLGAHLARREIALVWQELLRRVPDIHVVGTPQRLTASFINGIKHVDCDFTPA